MSKKTLILSQRQLDEIVGSNATYLDNANNDFAYNGNNEIFASGKLDGEDGKPYTTDKLSHELNPKNNGFGGWYGNRGLQYSVAPNINEMTKGEWRRKNLGVINEEDTNPMLTAKTFDTGLKTADGSKDVNSLGATKTALSRYNDAKGNLNNPDPEVSEKAAKTIEHMKENNPNLEGNEQQLNVYRGINNAANNNKVSNNSLGSNKLSSSPKSNGVDGKIIYDKK